MDVSGELARRISRRQFLFGGRNSGGGGSETGVLGTILGAAGVGVGVMALGSPGPSAQSFIDAYVQKNPTSEQTILTPDVSPSIPGLKIKQRVDGQSAGNGGAFKIRSATDDDLGWDMAASSDDGLIPNIRASVPDSYTLPGSFLGVIKRPSQTPYNAVGVDLGNNLGFGADAILLGDAADILGTSGPVISRTKHVFSNQIGGTLGTGAQVGLPTGVTGADGNPCAATHRHAFSGRFGIGPGPIRDASLGGATPAKFTRLISNNAWTLRRLSVFALTAPAGTGSDTYGVVNAAGTLQGTAVSLAVGATENATALQVTNLTGGTVYYFAVTARATTPALDVTLVPEYTMNV